MPISLDPRTFIHLLPKEREIWARFLPTIQFDAIRVDYDIHLGKGNPVPPGTPEYVRQQAQATTRKRCDAVAWFSESIVIYEVKDRAGMSAVGQLLNYKRLFVEEYKPALSVRMAVVCDRLEPDVLGSYEEAGIEVYVV